MVIDPFVKGLKLLNEKNLNLIVASLNVSEMSGTEFVNKGEEIIKKDCCDNRVSIKRMIGSSKPVKILVYQWKMYSWT